MRFLSFKKDDQVSIGGLVPNRETVVDLTEKGLPADLTSLIEMGEEGLSMAEIAIQEGLQIPMKEIEILAPFPRPQRNVMCVGKNYFEHSKEFENSGFDSTSGGKTVPDAPVIFTKALISKGVQFLEN